MKKRKQNSIPKDLGIKIGSPAEVLWTRVRNSCKTAIQSCKDELIVQEGILRLSGEMIRKEQGK